MLPPEAIKEFQKLCKKKGVKLTKKQATEQAYQFINGFRAVYGKKQTIVTLTNNNWTCLTAFANEEHGWVYPDYEIQRATIIEK